MRVLNTINDMAAVDLLRVLDAADQLERQCTLAGVVAATAAGPMRLFDESGRDLVRDAPRRHDRAGSACTTCPRTAATRCRPK